MVNVSLPEEVKPDVEGICPFCERKFFAQGGDDAHVLYEMPMCDTFERLDPIAYLRAVRTYFEGSS